MYHCIRFSLNYKYTSYFCRRFLCSENAISEFPTDWKETAILYVHWPYCKKRCSYCNFNKYISKNVDHKRMRKCLLKETLTLLNISGVKKINSIFFGGGTPSIAEPETIYQLIQTVSSHVTLDKSAEVTLEVNPHLESLNTLSKFKESGINRVSLGIQALKYNDLMLLGRDHSVKEACDFLAYAKELFPNKTSVDLIFGRPQQTSLDWEKELREVLALCDDHISLYQLTVERGTALFKQVQSGTVVLPSEDIMADLYQCSIKQLKQAGFHHYEVSNFARNGAYCQHNKTFWQGTNYIGIGPGAHGRFLTQEKGKLQREARIQTLEPDPWMAEVEKYSHGTRKIIQQTHLDILIEMLALGLRTSEGVLLKRLQKFFPELSLMNLIERNVKLRRYQDGGFLHLDNKCLKATSKGLFILDTLLVDLVNAIDNEESFRKMIKTI